MALASAEDDSLWRPIQLLGLGGAGQNLAEHIERSETPENQVRCLAPKVQEQDRLHISESVFRLVCLLARGVGDSHQRPREAAWPRWHRRSFRARS